MTPKMAYYSALAESAARDITSSRDQWTAFLTTSARLYKYPYSDQLMIFAQRPDATACAEYDLWNDKMRRYIKRGSKGIALVDNSGERPRLRYVFDVSDTGTRRDSRPVELWQMQEEHEPAIMEALSAAFDVSGERVGLDDLIYSAARKLAGEYWEDHSRQIFDIVADSYLEGYDEFNIGAAFRNAAATSIAYSVFSRSTVDADSYFEPENFLDIFDFNTQAASNVLGTAVTEMSGQIFREIERTIRNYERNRQAERSQNYDGTDLQTERRFSDSRNPAGDARGETSGQVRQDEESIPAGEQFAPVQSSDTDRETVPSPVGDSGHRNDESRTADGSADAAESGTGQEDTTDGMGTAHEHAESTGRGNSDRRTDYSVTHTDSFGQLSFLFPSEAEQIAKLDNTETIAESTQPSAFVISEDEVDRALRGGSGFSGGKMRIYALYQLQGDPKERAKFLKDEYGMGGHSYTFADGSHGFVDYNAKGLYIRSYEHDREKRLTWAEVDKALDQLIQKGEYLNDAEFSRYQRMDEDYGAALPMPTPAHVFPPAKKIEQIEIEEETAHLPGNGEVQDESEPEDGDFHEEDMLSSDSPANADEEFRVGDTVELDGKPFVIENVGMFDVQLRDLSSVFPIFRAESKEHLRELLHNEVMEHGAEQEQDIPVDAAVEDAAIAPAIAAQNFRITDTHLGEGGPKQKFRANMDAIHMLQTLEAEKRNATPEEQEILSKYVGWGGLADAFDESKSSWSAEYQELKNALSPEEYAAARASTLNAHYTSPTVIHAIYDAVEQMGFTKGNILEPAMGVGNFFGMMPESMEGSRLYGVELDSVTGRIAQKLYPNAEITVAGFETTDRRDFYDLAVGNVPFGNYKVSDKPYDKLGFSIHNYFFAKTLDQVRPGGVVAFVTSRYTMDAKNPDARQYMAQRAELLGAIRLPNNAFRANAGTDVVSDILFLKKREHPIDISPDWVHLGQTQDGLAMNSYFLEHPEMVLGEIASESTQYGKQDLTVIPIEGADLGEQLQEAITQIQGSYEPLMEVDDLAEDAEKAAVIPADPNVKNFSYTVVDGEVYFRENSIMRKAELNQTVEGRVKGMVELRQVVTELMNYQLEDYPEEDIQAKQRELNTIYDRFTASYGLVNSRANAQAFAEDSSYYLLCSLENLDENGNLESKADMFTKRTIRPERNINSVDTPAEALAVSIGERGKVDLPYMSELLGTPGEYDTILTELHGVIFKNPMENRSEIAAGWQTADEYLSGNVREKLKIAQLAAQNDPLFSVNVAALEKAQPKDLDASEIDVRLGATWIDRDYIQRFMEETFEPPFYLRRGIEVKFSEMTAEWQITGKSTPSRNDVHAYMTYGTSRANAYKILEDTLNLRDVRIYDTIEDADGKQKRVLNKKETTLAQQKQQAIKDAFQDWVWRDPRRREALVTRYNELFNSTRPREYDGTHIRFGGMNPEIKLREHQQNAIAHVLYGGNTLLAHEVGAGKTYEMVASAMEAKRLGLCQKSLFVVPNHLTLQWANEFLHLYPGAKLLVASKKDFETANRKKFCARIATGDYDAVIIGHSQFEKIPISPERQERMLQTQIDDIEEAISEMKYQRGENFTIKQMEKTRKTLQARLDKLQGNDRKDDVVTFEQLGIDRLFVDEAHSFKNLFLYTKMRNVAGLSTSEAQKSSDMFMKCQYMDELTGGRGVVFATGTPVSNSMTELYTMMRYLQYGTLQQKGLTHFDCWASTFGETTTAIELAPEGYTLVGR